MSPGMQEYLRGVIKDQGFHKSDRDDKTVTSCLSLVYYELLRSLLTTSSTKNRIATMAEQHLERSTSWRSTQTIHEAYSAQLKRSTRPTALNKADPRGLLRSAASIRRPAYAGPAGLRSAPYADAAPGTATILIGMMLPGQDPMPTGGAGRSSFPRNVSSKTIPATMQRSLFTCSNNERLRARRRNFAASLEMHIQAYTVFSAQTRKTILPNTLHLPAQNALVHATSRTAP